MIDVNKITSTLAKLPDAQLQQYAQMHKNDPYIMALAMTESNRRKELRSASQGQASQEQPKVVDKEIEKMGDMRGASPEQLARLMEMLEAKKQAEQEEFTGGGQAMPEEQGIGQLPAGNMDFANGGIVAFADGGDVERYQFGGTTFDPSGIPVFNQATQVDEDQPTLRERLGLGNRENRRVLEQVERDAAARRAPPAPITAPTAPVPKIVEETVADSPRVKVPSPSNFERAEALSSPTTLDSLQQKYFGDIDSQQATFKTMREGLVKGMKDVALANWEQDKKDAEERSSDKVYKSREERLAKQEQSMEGMGDRYLGLALLQAGAAMMSTPGGIGAALGKGISVGADRYAAGLDKINAAQAKFAEARDRLDELRLNRDDMSAKQIRESFREYKSAELKGQEFLLNTLEKDFGIKRDVMGKMFTAAADDLQTTRRIAAQKATAGKQDTNEQMKAALFADLKNKYPDDPTRVATEFNKAIAKASADPTALYNQELAKQLAEEQVKMAKMGNVALPGQKEKIQALQNQLFGGGGNQAKVASRDDVAATAKASGKTEQQVIEALKARGYTIQ